MRARAENETPETIQITPTREYSVSQTDKVRFEENARLSETLYDVFYAMIDGKLSLEEVENELARRAPELSLPQQALLSRIQEREKKGAGTAAFNTRLSTAPTLNEYYRMGHSFREFFYTGIARDGVDRAEISADDIILKPWGAVLVYVRNPETWKKVHRLEGSEDSGGFIRMSDFGQIKEDIRDFSYINEQFNRTVFVRRFPETEEKDWKEAERHELFHELYANILSKEQKIQYKQKAKREIFSEVKNELVAYLIGGRWGTSLHRYVTNSTMIWAIDLYKATEMKEDEQEAEINVEDVLPKYFKTKVAADLVRSALPEEETASLNMLQCLEKGTSALSKEQFDAIKKEARDFYFLTWYIRRNIARFASLEKRNFNEVIKAVLTAQSFEEILYKLERIDAEKETDVAACKTAGRESMKGFDIKCLDEKVYLAVEFRLKIKHLDRAMNDLESLWSSANFSELNKTEQNKVNGILRYWRSRKSSYEEDMKKFYPDATNVYE